MSIVVNHPCLIVIGLGSPYQNALVPTKQELSNLSHTVDPDVWRTMNGSFFASSKVFLNGYCATGFADSHSLSESTLTRRNGRSAKILCTFVLSVVSKVEHLVESNNDS